MSVLPDPDPSRPGALMLAAQRRTAILERVRSEGAVRVRELVEEFGVSDMTIRRDIEALARRGLVAKVHGGATAVAPHTTEEPGFLAKSTRHEPEKEAIAAHAATLVRPGTAIALSAGTTTWTLARRLVDVPELTVVTNSIPVAEVLNRRRGLSINMIRRLHERLGISAEVLIRPSRGSRTG